MDIAYKLTRMVTGEDGEARYYSFTMCDDAVEVEYRVGYDSVAKIEGKSPLFVYRTLAQAKAHVFHWRNVAILECEVFDEVECPLFLPSVPGELMTAEDLEEYWRLICGGKIAERASFPVWPVDVLAGGIGAWSVPSGTRAVLRVRCRAVVWSQGEDADLDDLEEPVKQVVI